ncbi:MAG: alpha/beta hydrolase [Alphaproteobacteria bacterium]|nr:alpha/beta hydrolase [Alphaproteobacteria bacterium]
MDDFLQFSDKKISYHYNENGGDFTVVFMHGTLSDKNSTKAFFLENFCQENNISFLSFDFSGHGLSNKKYTECSISDWLEDAIHVIQSIRSNKIILVGSSMGGWIAFLAAISLPKQIVGIIGLAPALDFTKELWKSFSTYQKRKIKSQGIIYTPCDWSKEGEPWGINLFTGVKQYYLTNKTIKLNIPIAIIHGKKDDCVSFKNSLKLIDLIKSNKCKLTLIKKSNHRLSDNDALDCLKKDIQWIISCIQDPS